MKKLILLLILIASVGYAQNQPHTNNSNVDMALSQGYVITAVYDTATSAFRHLLVDSNGNILDTITVTIAGATGYLDSVTIASGDSVSGSLQTEFTPIGLILPSGWTTANLTFQFSYDGTTFYNVYDEDGTELQYTGTAGAWIRLKPTDFAGAKYLKVRSGTSSTHVAQGAERVIYVIRRGY